METQPELGKMLTSLTQYDPEPIHLFSSVQGHGCLFSFALPECRIQNISENAENFLGKDIKDLLGAKLEQVFGSDLSAQAKKAASNFPWERRGLHLNVNPTFLGQRFDAYLYESEGLFVLELERHQRSGDGIFEENLLQNEINTFMAISGEAKDMKEVASLVCQSIRRITGLDRVMMYRFVQPHWYGEVIAEDRIAEAHSYINHRFPASDIAKPARELYLKNKVRLISDVQAEVSPILPRLNPKTRKPLDLSDSRLRSVGPVHLQHLRNMGVQASYSVAVTHNEELWGLITCHNFKPLYITQAQRTACEILANHFSIVGPLLEEMENQEDRLEFELKLKRILESLRLTSEPLDFFFKQHRSVTEAFRGGGVALVGKSLIDFAGLTPLKSDIEELAKWLLVKFETHHQQVLAIDHLSGEDPRWEAITEHASGVLAIKTNDDQNTLLLIFRPEITRQIVWGGDPRKNFENRGFQGDTNPRASFETWDETIKHHSLPWKKFETDGMLFIRDFIFDGLVKKENIIKELTKALHP